VKLRGRKRGQAFVFALLLLIAFVLLLILMEREKKKPLPKPVGKESARPRKEKKPSWKLAVIIDDVGYPTTELDEYLRFQGKLTFSVLPFLVHSRQYAGMLRERGFEVLLHIPMEPIGYPQVNPGIGAILISDSPGSVEKKISGMVESIPYALGANNHMGSKATQDRVLMGLVIDFLKKRNLFFIDSVTIGSSCAYETAAARNEPAARRDVFLDNRDDYRYISERFEELKGIARRKGTAIGIGHIHKTHTIEVLKDQLPELENEGFTLIFASEAVLN
jgi:polysaccharide deacetylase 2 family uncharacterized protein YibQ